MDYQDDSNSNKIMKFYNMEDSWERFNFALNLALSNTERYPRQTNFLLELSNALISASGQGRIDWEIMWKIDDKLSEYQRKLL